MDETGDRLWAVVLAAGEGTRMAPLTRLLYGWDLPKQFATLLGDRTLLQLTMDRIAPIIPPDRTVVVVDDAHEALADQQLRSYPKVQIVLQPGNRGTGPGVLLPLAHVRASDPDAPVVIFPADHHVQRPDAFLDGVTRAVAAAGQAPTGLALVGATATGPATDLGWIVARREPGAIPAGGLVVERFVEKPPKAQAKALLDEGGLWNTMVVAAARAKALWRLLRRWLPEHTRAIERYGRRIGQPDARAVLVDAYRRMSPADLSKAVLQNARGLSAVPMVDAGWSDCGTPERLLACLAGTQELKTFEARVRAAPLKSRERRLASQTELVVLRRRGGGW
jgi:mannose-1-phosphate guanylyltransferase